ncbi:MAG: ABC transporter permease [Alphaproteobacteria bacterium]|nr:ABC transporter permease [Alphaproteobacteria bacterium]
MNRILLVARRDFRQVIATRAFKVTLLFVPVMLGLVMAATSFLRPPSTVAYVMADAGGSTATAVERRLKLDYQRQVLRDLSAYAARWNLPQPGGSRYGYQADDTAVEDFIAQGGAETALKGMHPPPDATSFKPPPLPYVRVPVPKDVPVDQGPAAFGAAIAPYLASDIQTPEGKRPLAVAVYVASGGPARLWTNGRNGNALIDTIQEERTRQLRLALLSANGVTPVAAARIEGIEAPLLVTAPPAGGGRSQLVVRSIVPLVLVYLLLMSSLITGGMMLQGVIDERSNRLLEAVLACVEPRELMLGKLIGLGAVGLTILMAWIGCALLAAFSMEGVVADYLRPSLAALNQPWMLPVLAFYFFCGYLILAMIYLTIGSLSNSLQDAQVYLMPVTMAILLPVMLMVQASITNPGSWLPGVMSWIPIYTPFAMLARLGGGVPAWEMAATGLLLAAFVALELVLLGRVFRASLLSAGQPLGWGGFVKQMLRRD